jgi:hypothetical protein
MYIKAKRGLIKRWLLIIFNVFLFIAGSLSIVFWTAHNERRISDLTVRYNKEVGELKEDVKKIKEERDALMKEPLNPIQQ